MGLGGGATNTQENSQVLEGLCALSIAKKKKKPRIHTELVGTHELLYLNHLGPFHYLACAKCALFVFNY